MKKNEDNFLVVKKNKLLEASHALSLAEQRLLLSLVSQIDSQYYEELDPMFNPDALPIGKLKFELTVDTHVRQLDLNHNNAYNEMQKAAERLQNRVVKIDDPDPKGNADFFISPWVAGIKYSSKNAKIEGYFAPMLIPYLIQLSGNFTKYKISNVKKMKSIYGIRIYELVVMWYTREETTRKEIELDGLKKVLGIEHKYKSIKDFKKYVLDRAAKDINDYSDYTLKVVSRKTGRIITHIQFHFQPKNKDKKIAKRGRLINNVSETLINKHARPGESTDQVVNRILEKNLK